MKDGAKTKEQLIDKMNILRQRIVDSEKMENESERMEALLKESHDKIERLSEERSAKFHMITDQLMEEIDNCRRVENQLRSSEERYKRIYENIQDIYYEISMDGIILELSPAIERLTKYQRIELIGKSIYELYAFPEERKKFLKVIKEQGAVNDYEITLKDKEGQLTSGSLCSKIVFDERGVPHKIIGTLRDITERKHAEEALRESEERFRSVVENIGIGIVLLSPNMEILALNNQMKKWFPDIDVAKKPICYKTFNIPPREAVCSYCSTYKTFQDGQVHETVTATPTGETVRNYRIISSPVKDKNGKIISTIEMVEDITESKKMRERLEASATWYRTLFETTAAATIIIEEDTTIFLVNTEFEKLSGYAKEEVEGKRSWTEFVVKKDLAMMREYHCLRRIDPQAAPRNYEFGFIGKDGHMRDVFMTIAIIPGTTRSVASLLDITERKQTEEFIKESEEKYRSLASTADFMYLMDKDGRYLFMNEKYVERIGLPRDEVIGRTYGEFHMEEDTKKFAQNIKKVFKSGAPIQHEHKSGRDGRYFLRTFSPVKDQEGKTTIAVTVVSKDITDRRQTEEALKKRERELEVKSRNLEELNTALKVLLKQREDDKEELEERTLSNVKHLVMPYIEKLKNSSLEAKDASYMSILESNLKDIVSPLSQRLSSKYMNLTPKELQVANLIKDGKTTKDIAEVLNTSTGTVDFHRNNIRNKLNLKNKRANLRSYLMTLS